MRQRAAVSPRPTLMVWPPSLFTTAKPYSSVRSSPMNTGVLPENGRSRTNSWMAMPLSRLQGVGSPPLLPPRPSHVVAALGGRLAHQVVRRRSELGREPVMQRDAGALVLE